jgi:hypothetical protein
MAKVYTNEEIKRAIKLLELFESGKLDTIIHENLVESELDPGYFFVDYLAFTSAIESILNA